MIAVRLSSSSCAACSKASHIEPSAISESPHRHHDAERQAVEPLAGERDADRDRQALAERARGHVDPRDPRHRVALELRAELRKLSRSSSSIAPAAFSTE